MASPAGKRRAERGRASRSSATVAHDAHASSGHAHGPAPDLRVAPLPRAVLLAVLALVGLATVVGLVVLWPDGDRVEAITDEVSFAAPGVTFPDATVVEVQPACPSVTERDDTCGSITARVRSGVEEGERVTVQVPPPVSGSGLAPGDTVKLQRVPTQGGTGSDGAGSDGAGSEGAGAGAAEGAPAYSYFGTVRTTPLLLLTLLFAVLVVAVARLRGVLALVGLVFSGLVLWWFVLPALLVGEPGLAVGLTAAAAIMFVVLYTTHGLSLRTSTALAGTFAGVLVTAGLGTIAAGATRITGIADESAGVLSTLAGDLSFSGLFACALVIAGLGVLNDVTIAQSSSVWEIRAAAPAMSRAAVFASGMRIGRDHIASTIYTIVFAYAGTALAMLLMLQLYGLPMSVLLTTEDITQEIVRTLASSIGLVLAVPLTTGIAAVVVPGPKVESGHPVT